MIDRFLSRCFATSISYRVSVRRVLPQPDNDKVKAFYARANGRPILELYHSLSFMATDDTVASIFKHGLRSGSACNKGYGVYLANHGRYALNWGGEQVMVCHVIYEPDKLNRYRSEIFSPSETCSSEFVLTSFNSEELLLPVACFEIEKIRSTSRNHSDTDQNKEGFVEHGAFGCDACDRVEFKNSDGSVSHVGRRCDCKQLPAVLDTDIIVPPTTS